MLSRSFRLLHVANVPRVVGASSFGGPALSQRLVSTLPESTGNAEVDKIFEVSMLNQRDRMAETIKQQILKFQKHKNDCGSSGVQAIVATERILNMTRHYFEHSRDKNSLRGFRVLINHRKKMMAHLMRTDPEAYRKVAVAIAELTNTSTQALNRMRKAKEDNN